MSFLILYAVIDIDCKGNEKTISKVSEFVSSMETSNSRSIPYHGRVDRKNNGGYDYSLRFFGDSEQIDRFATKIKDIVGVDSVTSISYQCDE